ncbi:MAG: hypothetical protein EGQ82_02875, partial [Clostridiales bacterium]|nr:hypothetical protein [Clostridiales bacterium]
VQPALSEEQASLLMAFQSPPRFADATHSKVFDILQKIVLTVLPFCVIVKLQPRRTRRKRAAHLVQITAPR